MAHLPHNISFTPEAERSINDLSALMGKVRSLYRRSGVSTFDTVSVFSPEELATFQDAMVRLFAEIDLSYALVESGIPMANSFGGESMRIIKSAILPYVYDERDLRVVIQKVFHHKKDVEIFAALAEAHGADWICANAHQLVPDSTAIQVSLENAAKIISYRIAAIGMEEELAVRAGKDESLITPFLEQNRDINELLVSLEKANREKAAEDFAQATVMLKQCQSNIKSLDKASAENGTSLRQTYLLNRSSLLIERLLVILALVHEIEEEHKVNGFCTLITDIIQFELKPKKLRDFVSSNIQMIAYRITEHKRMTGEHYITSGSREFFDMFVSACGGGFIVSFMVIIKLMVHHFDLPPLWEGLAYSLNYAIGFVIVQLLHFTIATKQPAMTAAYIAASLDGTEPGEDHYKKFASTIAAVSRSQMVSFAGNLLVVFPATLIWILLITILGGDHLLEAPVAQKMLKDVSPVLSLSALYAAFAGFYLFLAGLISGFGDNKVIVSRIGLRLMHHPWLARHIPPGRLMRLSLYIENNLGGLMGNIAVGFMLGMTGFFGHITGLPLDIRHVTFSMGNFALGLFGTHFHVTKMILISSLSGLAVIGIVNFIVSFWLAIFVAMRSRGLYLRNYPDLVKSVLRYFRHHPGEFFWPRKEEKAMDEVIAEAEETH
jgi:site-specific recombinase